MNKKIIKLIALIFTAALLKAAPLFAQNQMPQFNGFGEWIYFGGQYQAKIDIDRDGDMDIEVKDLSARTETEWKGWWTATADTITFNVYRMETENMSGMEMKRKARLNETWTITYAFSSTGGLSITCANLPEQIASATEYQRKW